MTTLTRGITRSFALGTSLGLLSLAGCGSEEVQPDQAAATADDAPGPGGDDDMAVADDAPAADDVAAPEPSAEPIDAAGGMLMADFEAWDGATALPEWSFQYGPPETPYTAGPFELTDTTGDYAMQMVAGHDSVYALSFSNSMATDWGGGAGFWMGATDVTSFAGISFWVKGTNPGGTMGISLGRAETDEDCEAAGVTDCTRASVEFPLPAEWTQLSFDWSDFAAGVGIDGVSYELPAPNITAMSFSAHMIYAQDASGEWLPEPGAFDISIDDVTFY